MAKKTSRSWDEHVRRWRESGLTAREYANREGLRTSTLYGWSTRLNRGDRSEPARFIEISAPAAPPSVSAIQLRIGVAVVIAVEPGFDAQLLRDVVTALVPS